MERTSLNILGGGLCFQVLPQEHCAGNTPVPMVLTYLILLGGGACPYSPPIPMVLTRTPHPEIH